MELLHAAVGACCCLWLIYFWNAQIAGDFILVDGVDDDFHRCATAALRVQEDGLIDVAALLVGALVVGYDGDVELVLFGVGVAQSDCYVADFLVFVPAVNGELSVIAFAELAEFVNFIVILGDESAEFAARHLQIVLGVRTTPTCPVTAVTSSALALVAS